MSRYLVIYTGGTIGMKMGKNGLVPDQQTIIDVLNVFSKKIQINLHICEPLIDSSAVTLKDWHELIGLIQKNHTKFDGIMVIHGTDTMAYTASVLTYFLQGLNKPIVFTGAQYPLSHKKSDGLSNLKRSFYVMTQTPIKEPVIVFGDHVFRGVSATKIDTVSNNAFESPYEKPLGIFQGEEFALNRLMFKQPAELGVSNLVKKLDTQLEVATYYLTPGINSSLIAKSLTRDGTDSAILLSYGNGNVPNDLALIEAVKLYVHQGKLLINKSQILRGVSDKKYAQSHALYQAGALPADNITLEAIQAKLLFILS